MSNSNVFQKVRYKAPSRSRFDLSYDHKLSMDMGQLIPTMWKECMPGDVWKCSQVSQIKFAPMIAPIMHPIMQYSHTFFVPFRLLWGTWEKFITHDNSGVIPVHPYITVSSANQLLMNLLDPLGVPFFDIATDPVNISAMIPAAYNLIWQEYYRDQNLQQPLVDPQEFMLVDGDNTSFFSNLPAGNIRYRAWMHDYFTSCLPFAQKGVQVSLPVDIGDLKVFYNTDPGDGPTTLTGSPTNIVVPPNTTDNTDVAADGLYAQGGGVTSSTINDLRSAWQLQRWLEKNARAGSRYTEVLRSHFAVRPEDYRLQRPEYVYGSSAPVIISEVLNTSGGFDGVDPDIPTSPPQGNMSGHGQSVNASRQGFYKAREHGVLMTITSVMPLTAYQQGLERAWSKEDQFDYAWPEFANLGEQEVLNKEIWIDGNDLAQNGTFGYQSRYAEMKYSSSRVTGDFKNSLNFWHMGRIFESAPALDAPFVVSNPTKRIFAVTDDVVNHLYVHVLNRLSVLRALPYYGTPT